MAAKHKEAIHILLTFDDNYAEHAAVTINSILTNNPERLIVFHIFYAHLRQDIIDALTQWMTERQRQIIFYNLTEDDMRPFIHLVRKGGNLTIETFFRLLCTELLPKGLKKILYMDIDMIAVRALDELWGIDVSGYAVAASTGYAPSMRKARLGLELNDRYLQGGVLIINLDYWRENKIFNELTQYTEVAEYLETCDQDALNAVLKGRWMNIPLKYNATHGVFHSPNFVESKDVYYEIEEKKEAFENPVIIHYTGPGIYKPWFSNSISVNKGKFLNYRVGAPYANKKLKKFAHPFVIAAPPGDAQGVLVALLDSHPQVFTFPQWNDMLVDSFLPILNDLRAYTPDRHHINQSLGMLRGALNTHSLNDLEEYAFKKRSLCAMFQSHPEAGDFNFDYYEWERNFFTNIMEMYPPEMTFINLIKLFCKTFHKHWRDCKQKFDSIDTYAISVSAHFQNYGRLFKEEPSTKVIYLHRPADEWLLSWVKQKYEVAKGQFSYEKIIDLFFKDERTKDIIYLEYNCHDLQKQYPCNFMVIEFNELIKNHEKLLLEIADFIGIDMDPCLLTPTLNGTPLTLAGTPIAGLFFDKADQQNMPDDILKYAMEKYDKVAQSVSQVQMPTIPHCKPVLRKWWCRAARAFAPRVTDALLLAASGTFDAKYYFATYPGLLKKSRNPIWGYVRRGALEGRNPNSWFSTEKYLSANPEVKKSGVNPLVYYLYGENGR